MVASVCPYRKISNAIGQRPQSSSAPHDAAALIDGFLESERDNLKGNPCVLLLERQEYLKAAV